MNGAFAEMGRLMAGARWAVLAVSIALVALAGATGASRAAAVLKTGGFELPGTESTRAADVLRERFGIDAVRNATIVFRSRELTASDPAFRSEVDRVLAGVARVPGVDRVTSPHLVPERAISADGRTGIAVVLLAGDDSAVTDAVAQLREATAGSSLEVFVTGSPGVSYDITRMVEEDLRRAEIIAFPAVAVLLLVAFRSVFAALLPLLLGGIVITLTLAELAVLGRITEVSIYALNVATMFGLGLAIDFSLLLVSRFREELARGLTVRDAVVRTAATAGRAVAFSGLTVVAAMSVLLSYESFMVRSISLAILLVAGTSVVAALTLVPALLALLGRRIDLISWRATPRTGHGFWYRWSHLVMGRPVVAIVLAGGALLLLAVPVLEMTRTQIGLRSVPTRFESRAGADVIDEAFGPGSLAPLQILVDTGRPDGALAARGALRDLEQALRARPEVASVTSLASAFPAGVELPRTRAALPPDPRLRAALDAFVDRDEARYAMVRVALHDPQSPKAFAFVRELRATVLQSIDSLGGSRILVGGSAAFFADFDQQTYGQFPLLFAGVLAVVFAILLVFFRSLALPAKAVALNLLSIGAAYGVLVLLFQEGLGAGPLGFTPLDGITALTPILCFSILFGLSTDYEVFVLSRVREAYAASGDNAASVAFGVERTAGLITAAAAIMVTVFAAFATAESIVIKEMGVALVAAIAIDATLVRLVLLPAAMKLLGRWNWWLPAIMARRLPTVAHEASPEAADA